MGYRRPPLIEALVDFQFAQPVSIQAVGRVITALRPTYPLFDDVREYSLAVDSVSGKATVNAGRVGSRVFSPDAASIVISRTNGCAAARLAPYLGWQDLREAAKLVWDKTVAEAPQAKLNRVGVKFLNRFDIPDEAGLAPLAEYLTVFAVAPTAQLKSIDHFNVQVDMASPNVPDARVVIGTSRADSPSPTLASVMLVIDVLTTSVPASAEEMWPVVDSLASEALVILRRA